MPKNHEQDQRHETEHAAHPVDHTGDDQGLEQAVGQCGGHASRKPFKKTFAPSDRHLAVGKHELVEPHEHQQHDDGAGETVSPGLCRYDRTKNSRFLSWRSLTTPCLSMELIKTVAVVGDHGLRVGFQGLFNVRPHVFG